MCYKESDSFWLARAVLALMAMAAAGQLAQGGRVKEDGPELARRALSVSKQAEAKLRTGDLFGAERLARKALAASRETFQGGPQLANCLTLLGVVLHAQGRPAAAETYLREAVILYRREYSKTDFSHGHPALANCLAELGRVQHAQGRFTEAERSLREAEAMYQRLFGKRAFPAGHPALVACLCDLARILRARGELTRAAAISYSALAAGRRIYSPAVYPRGHPALAACLVEFGRVQHAQGKFSEAERSLREALSMHRLLLPRGEHNEANPHLVVCLHDLAVVLADQGRQSEAGILFLEVMAAQVGTLEKYGRARAEGDILTLAASSHTARDRFLSLWPASYSSAGDGYASIWRSRAAASRQLERKWTLPAGRSAKTSRLFGEVAALRRQRAALLFAPEATCRSSRQARSLQLALWAEHLEDLEGQLGDALARSAKASPESAPADLQKALPANTAFIDFLRYNRYAYGRGRAADPTPSYVAFVVTKGSVERIELGPAAVIEEAVAAWMTAIRRRGSDYKYSAALGRCLWEKIGPRLPVDLKTIYLAPDMALARIPWAALPGAKPGTVLLEEYALCTVPHGQFLLDRLRASSVPARSNSTLLLVGDVEYDHAAVERTSSVTRVRKWSPLQSTAQEIELVRGFADARGLSTQLLTGRQASTNAVLAALPHARVAHLGTHGYFADDKFRSMLRVDPKLFARRGKERIGLGARCPLVLSGLVFAGANDPETPERGFLTAEAVVGSDFSGMELAVLSACESGRGDMEVGEGVFGIERAFHLAGCQNVIASLWELDDDSTLALMGLFYRNLLNKGMPPREALRNAQLAVYRNPGLVTPLGSRRSVTSPDRIPQDAVDRGKTAPTWAWAAFTFSGVGDRPLVEPLREEQPLPDSTWGVETALWIGGAVVALIAGAAYWAWRWWRQRGQPQPQDSRPNRQA